MTGLGFEVDPSMCTEVSGVENIAQSVRQIKPAQLAFGRTLILYSYLLTYLLTYYHCPSKYCNNLATRADNFCMHTLQNAR